MNLYQPGKCLGQVAYEEHLPIGQLTPWSQLSEKTKANWEWVAYCVSAQLKCGLARILEDIQVPDGISAKSALTAAAKEIRKQ